MWACGSCDLLQYWWCMCVYMYDVRKIFNKFCKKPTALLLCTTSGNQSIIMATALVLLRFFCTPPEDLTPSPLLAEPFAPSPLLAAAEAVARRILPALATTRRDGTSSTSIVLACSALSSSITCFLDSLSLILMPWVVGWVGILVVGCCGISQGEAGHENGTSGA